MSLNKLIELPGPQDLIYNTEHNIYADVNTNLQFLHYNKYNLELLDFMIRSLNKILVSCRRPSGSISFVGEQLSRYHLY